RGPRSFSRGRGSTRRTTAASRTRAPPRRTRRRRSQAGAIRPTRTVPPPRAASPSRQARERGRRPARGRGKVPGPGRGGPMNTVHCPICERPMDGGGPAEWPEYPFCSPRCKLIDLGRWLGEAYSYRTNVTPGEEERRPGPDEENIPP